MKKLTKKAIQEFNDTFGKGDKVVDAVMITEDYGYTIEISKQHSVWKCFYRFDGNMWRFADSELLA